MCGIYGMVAFGSRCLIHPEILPAMGSSLTHRGPDSRGLFQSENLALGSERLRVIDLRAEGDQPFGNREVGLTLVCNGEIYNSTELRRRYADYPFRSRSDVEVILPLFLDKGHRGLPDLDGMFAVAIWDHRANTMTLARDRAGEKPLFYAQVGEEILFSSEVKTLLLHPSVSRDLDPVAVAEFMKLGYVPEPRTAFKMIRKVRAGTALQLSASGQSEHRYWDPTAIQTVPTTESAAISQLQGLLEAAVQRQMVADVPVGVFLSGGMDSALIAALAARDATKGQLYTLSAKFAEESYDESNEAARMAKLLGTEHHEVIVDETSMLDALSAVIDHLAEPLADPAILPTQILAKTAREHVTVIMSGEGADELFGGYPTYLGHRISPFFLKSPALFRRAARAALNYVPASRKKVSVDFLLRRFFDGLDMPWPDRHFAWFGSGAHHLLSSEMGSGCLEQFADDRVSRGLASEAMLLDYRTYLPDNLLVKNDRATMQHSLEARAPFLDHELSVFAMSMPENFKVRGFTTKWLLKKAAEKWLPEATVARKKRGLSVPIASWLDSGLRSEVDRLLSVERIESQGLFDSRRVTNMLKEHRSRKANHAKPLWTLMVFQFWHERWGSSGGKGL